MDTPSISSSMTGEAQYTALDPRGYVPEVELIPLASRSSDLNNKVVYIINSMPQGTGLEGILDKAAEVLQSRFSNVKIVQKNRGAKYM
ncbi:hypothetical protein ACFLZG_07600, partial [Thermodesulfobacteriota bacterium]